VQALDNLVGQIVTPVFDLLDFVCLVPDGRIGRQHLVQDRGTSPNLHRQRDEIIEELFLARYESESERHVILRPES
jgi:hypothetical protein